MRCRNRLHVPAQRPYSSSHPRSKLHIEKHCSSCLRRKHQLNTVAAVARTSPPVVILQETWLQISEKATTSPNDVVVLDASTRQNTPLPTRLRDRREHHIYDYSEFTCLIDTCSKHKKPLAIVQSLRTHMAGMCVLFAGLASVQIQKRRKDEDIESSCHYGVLRKSST